MNRLFSIDLLKSISIFGVVFIHSALLLDCHSIIAVALLWSFQFAVPCFVMLWAYHSEKSFQNKNKEEQKAYTKKRLLHLFVVFLFWSIIYFLLLVDWQTLTTIKLISIHFSGYGWSGQYYFIILFQLIYLFPLLRHIYSGNRLIYLSVLFMVAVLFFIWEFGLTILSDPIRKLGDRPFIFWLPYVFTGIALARGEVYKLPAVFIFSILLIPVEFYALSHFNIEHTRYITFGICITSVMSCIAFLQYVQEPPPSHDSALTRIVGYIGQNTMTIFVSNPLIIILLKKLLDNIAFTCSTTFEKVMIPFISTIVILAITLFLSALINISPLAKRIN